MWKTLKESIIIIIIMGFESSSIKDEAAIIYATWLKQEKSPWIDESIKTWKDKM